MAGNINKSVQKLSDELGGIYKDFLKEVTKTLRKHDGEVRKLLEEEQKTRVENIRKKLKR